MPPFLVTWLAKPVSKYLSIALVSLILLGGFYVKGRHDGFDLCAGKLAAQELEWQAKISDLQLEHQRQSDKAAADFAKTSADLEKQIAALRRHPLVITKYVPASVDSLVPNGLVTLHDRAASGKDLEDDVENAAGQSTVKLSEYGSAVAGNYNSCAVDRAKLKSLQAVVLDYMAKQKGLTK